MKVKQKLVLLVATGLLGAVIVTGAALLQNRQAVASAPTRPRSRPRYDTMSTAT